MLKFRIFLVRVWFKLLGVIAPQYGAKRAFLLFQTTPFKKVREKEKEFFELADTFTVETELEKVTCYELGNPSGQLVVLVHGWESNAGSLSALAFELVKRGCYVVAFDLPAHGRSKLRRNNLVYSAMTLRAVIRRLNPARPFSVVSHSFGSAVTTLALKESGHSVDQLVFLTSPNAVMRVFRDYQKIVALPENIFVRMVRLAEEVLKIKVEDLVVEKMIKQVDYRHLLLIHDERDRIIPFVNSVNIQAAAARSELMKLQNAGHYRMLWNPEVVKRVVNQLVSRKSASPQTASTPV